MSEIGSGGMGKMRIQLMNAIARAGYRVDLVLGKRQGEHALALHDAVRVFDLGTTHAVFGVAPLAAYLRRHRPRILLTQRIRVTVLAHRARSLARVSTRIFATGNTHESIAVREYPPREQRKRLRRIRHYFARNDGMIAVSRGVAADHARLMGWPLEAIHVAPNPVLTQDVDALSREPVDHPWFQLDGPPVILGIGRLQPAKDFHTLIDSFARLRQKRNARLVILGDGPLREELESMAKALGIADSFDLPGFVDNPYAWLARSRMFVLSSRWEGLPNALIEAMAVDTPVVATDCRSGPAEILDDGHHGPLVPVGDVDALARAMESVWDTPPTPGHLRHAAFANYTAERSAAAYIEALGLNRRPAPT